MIRVVVEVREDAALSTLEVRAESIGQALNIARGGLPEREVRVVFPIEVEGFFEPGDGTSADGRHTEAGVPDRELTGRGHV